MTKSDRIKIAEWFLRVALSAGFLSAVADRFGLWNKQVSAWGNWPSFVEYTHSLLPFLNDTMVSFAAGLATLFEVVFGLLLLIDIKTSLVAKSSGCLLLAFALAMAASKSIKAPLDYSVFTASAAAFLLGFLTDKSSSKKG